MIFPKTTVRADDTLGVQIGKVTRISGTQCWYTVDAGFERGPARIPVEIQQAATVTGGDVSTVTPKPLVVGQLVAVQATATRGQFVLARY